MTSDHSLELLDLIITKINQYEFHYFSDRVMLDIKKYAGLHRVFHLKLLQKMHIVPDPVDTTQVNMCFENKVIEYYCRYFSLQDNIFCFEQTIENAVDIYDNAASLLSSASDPLVVKLTQGLLHALYKNFLQYFEKKNQSGSNYGQLKSQYEDIAILFNNGMYDACLSMISKANEEGEGGPYLKWVEACSHFFVQKNYFWAEKILKALEEAYLPQGSGEDYIEISLYYRMSVYFQKSKILELLNLSPKSYTGFPVDYCVNMPTSDFPCQDHVKHFTTTSTKVKDRFFYQRYLCSTFDKKEPIFSKVWHDYMALESNTGNHANVVNFYRTHEFYIKYYLKKFPNPSFRYNVIFTLELGYFRTDRQYDLLKFHDFARQLNICPEMTNIYGRKMMELHSRRDSLIEYLGKKRFTICIENNSKNDDCLICHEPVADNHITTIRCECCKKELGHFSCLFQWLRFSPNTCPNCRTPST